MALQDQMTPEERTREAATYEAGANYARQQALVLRHTNAAGRDDVERACLERAARAWDDLATYYAGKAAGFRQ